jgi:hypothetical protein
MTGRSVRFASILEIHHKDTKTRRVRRVASPLFAMDFVFWVYHENSGNRWSMGDICAFSAMAVRPRPLPNFVVNLLCVVTI